MATQSLPYLSNAQELWIASEFLEPRKGGA
jgi:hypothetical protein